MAAAILTASLGEVYILEGKDRVGKKLLSTGNGRGNISNLGIHPGRYHSSNEALVATVLEKWGRNQALEFFYSLGMDTVAEESGKIYPGTLQSSTVVNVFRRALEERGVSVFTEAKVLNITREKGRFHLFTGDGVYDADVVLLATGGRSAGATGSDGSGYPLAKSLGHRITETLPALVQLKGRTPYGKHVKGTKVQTKVSLLVDGSQVQRAFGELLFTDYGLSGPPILDLSRAAVLALSRGRNVQAEFSLVNYLTEERKGRIEELFYVKYQDHLSDFLTGILHKRFHHVILRELSLSGEEPLYTLEGPKKEALFQMLFMSRMTITGSLGFREAQVTQGGVDAREVKETMESKICPGLFLIGEVLDVDGDCGGFNLQWAWSSAMAAGAALQEFNKVF